MHALPKFRRGEQVGTLLEIAAVCSLFRSQRGEHFANVPQSALSMSAYPLDSLDFKAWMAHRFHNETGALPTASALRTVLHTLQAQAEFGQTGEAPAGPRLLPANQAIVLDLADAASRCVEISKQGWEPKDGVIFAFQRNSDTGQLPAPAPSGDHTLEHLRILLNIPAGPCWTRTLTWLTAAMRPEGPYPILILRGASGTGKSTAARMLRSLLDPARTPLQTLPNTANQMHKAAGQQRILAFDDVRRIPVALTSSLGKIADETTPIILALSADSKAELPENLARRSLIVDLAEPEQARTLFSLRRAFEALQPQVLGALCTAASQALAGFEEFAEATYPRLADATAWTLAAASALHLTETEIREAIPGPSNTFPLLPSRSSSTVDCGINERSDHARAGHEADVSSRGGGRLETVSL
jgi:hypothetical protein